MIDRVMDDCVYPVSWGKNQKGMQASEQLTESERAEAVAAWFERRGVPYEDAAARQIRQLNALGVSDTVRIPRLEAGSHGDADPRKSGRPLKTRGAACLAKP